jgi:hypothetical protein
MRQELDLWTGIITSRWRFSGTPVAVVTCCHPSRDAISIRVESPACAIGGLGVELAFPYGSPAKNASDWNRPDRHRSEMAAAGRRMVAIVRTLDATRYTCSIHLDEGSSVRRHGEHAFLVTSGPGNPHLSFVAEFSQDRDPERLASHGWSRPAPITVAVLAGGRLPEPPADGPLELERRIVLRPTAINAPALFRRRAGLTCNSWYGKFHLEMHWWHAAHFPLWGRPGLLERSLAWYGTIREPARRRAREQGYAGARWPKMTGPDGAESPSAINPLIIWQQPHPTMLAELVWRSRGDRATLERYADLVFDSADDAVSPAAEKIGPDEALRILAAGEVPGMKTGITSPPKPFFNPHLLVATEERRELRKAFFARLLGTVKVYLLNSARRGPDHRSRDRRGRTPVSRRGADLSARA